MEFFTRGTIHGTRSHCLTLFKLHDHFQVNLTIHPFVVLSRALLCEYVIICSPAGGRLGCFWIWAVRSKAVMNIHDPGMSGSYDPRFNFLRSYPSIFQSGFMISQRLGVPGALPIGQVRAAGKPCFSCSGWYVGFSLW